MRAVEDRRRNTARVVGIAQLFAGATMVLTPARVARTAAGRGPVAPPVIVRILGLRMVGQGALTVARPSRVALEIGAGTDAIHALSMAALIAVAPKYRRTALVSASIAGASLAASLGARG